MAFSTEEHLAIGIIFTVCSLLSVLGSFFIILSFILFKNVRSFAFSLILIIGICDFGTALAALSNSPWFAFKIEDQSIMCQIQAAILQFMMISGLMWTACLSVHTFLLCSGKKTNERKTIIAYHSISWGYAAITTIIPFFTNSWGLVPGSNWCWIKNDRDPCRLFLYGMAAIVCLVNTLVYIFIRRRLSKSNNAPARRLVNRLSIYVVGVVPIWLWLIGARLHDAIWETSIQFWIEFPVSFYPILGFFNSLVYGTSHRFLSNWKELITCRKKKRKDPKEYASLLRSDTDEGSGGTGENSSEGVDITSA